MNKEDLIRKAEEEEAEIERESGSESEGESGSEEEESDPRMLPPVPNAALAIPPPRSCPRSTRNISIRKEPWPLPANRTMSTRKRNRTCRNSLSCRGRSIGKPNWIR